MRYAGSVSQCSMLAVWQKTNMNPRRNSVHWDFQIVFCILLRISIKEPCNFIEFVDCVSLCCLPIGSATLARSGHWNASFDSTWWVSNSAGFALVSGSEVQNLYSQQLLKRSWLVTRHLCGYFDCIISRLFSCAIFFAAGLSLVARQKRFCRSFFCRFVLSGSIYIAFYFQRLIQ